MSGIVIFCQDSCFFAFVRNDPDLMYDYVVRTWYTLKSI